MASGRMKSDFGRRGKPEKSRRRKFRRYAGKGILLLSALCSVIILYVIADSRLMSREKRIKISRSADEAGNACSSSLGTKGRGMEDEGEKGGEGDEEEDWQLILVNKWNPMPEDYQVELTELSNGQSVDERIYPALQKMFDTARSEGIYPTVASGYRTAEKQQDLMEEKIAEYQAEGLTAREAKRKAKEWVAVPGTSEHQLGLGVDINADGVHSRGKEVYEWLDRNGYKYGFIRRYPQDKTEITGIINEPWHYRYVGTTAAEEIHRQGVCLEEYLLQVR